MIPDDCMARHRERFKGAQQACRDRGYWTAFAEQPEHYPDSAAARARGDAAFAAQLGRDFDLDQPGVVAHAGEEISPYTQAPLGIQYPQSDPDALYTAARQAMARWAQADAELRIGVLMEVVDRHYRALFEFVGAVMHTTGQSFGMSYAGSGANALDRAIEVLIHAHAATTAVPPRARWERRFGSTAVRLDKTYRRVPRGVAVCFTCASFPTWNAWPSMMASLATGNAVIVKPHPTAVLPMALSVRLFREVLQACGFDPNLVTLALDTTHEPLGKKLVRHPATAIVDFTGSARFGAWVEQNAPPALCFTETSGVNTVILESCEDLEAVTRSLATTLSLFSAQMCTSPQNIYLPRAGVRVGGRRVPAGDVAAQLADAVGRIAGDPRKAANVLAAIQAPQTLELLETMRQDGARAGRVLLESRPYRHPDYPAARTATPLMLSVPVEARALYGEERFGPVSFVIDCEDRDAALARATGDAHAAGSLTAFLYSTDAAYVAAAEQAYAAAGAQLTINLTGPMPLNFAAAYSDYHVTGLNPAGNATLTDLAFVASRFRIAQSRRPAA